LLRRVRVEWACGARALVLSPWDMQACFHRDVIDARMMAAIVFFYNRTHKYTHTFTIVHTVYLSKHTCTYVHTPTHAHTRT